ncbi:hypothetical protein [Paenibacillus sp. FSL H8-0034]|uniref:hypothetical protein n=1 Tax=Paenibacillus sp. FSL H8-0034 TaxID=2954671 RepID=UPI0030F9B5D7
MSSFKSIDIEQNAYSVRMALDSLIIKERLGLSDHETTQQIGRIPIYDSSWEKPNM